MTDLTFSIRVNNDMSPSAYLAAVRRAEAAGFDQIWLSNDLMLHSAMAMLPLAAARTNRIKLGIGILNPYTIHPSEIAMYFRTLGLVVPGRLLLGIAAGAGDFLDWVGLDRSRPMKQLAEAVAGIRYLMGETDWFPDNWASSVPRLTPGDATPIYIGAMSPKMLELAGKIGDGVLPLLFPPERYGEARRIVMTGAQGREIDIAACVWCSIAPDPRDAEAALAERIAYYGASFSRDVIEGIGLSPTDLVPAREAIMSGQVDQARRMVPSAAMSLGIAGAPEAVVEQCAALIDNGASHVSFGPPLGPDPIAAIGILGDQVVRRLAGS